MPDAHIRLEPADAAGVATLRIANPGKMNALTLSMWRELRAVFDALRDDPSPPRVIVVRGADREFVAGADIEEFPQFRFEPESLAAYHEDIVGPALRAMLDCDVPLVAHIEGACIGGGLEIAACCDLRLCEPSSRFGVPIARLGLPMAPAEVEIVSHIVGQTLLRELLIESRLMGAVEAHERGVVTRVIDAEQLEAEVRRVALHIAGLSPQAMRLNKRVLRAFARPTFSEPEDRATHYACAEKD
ncbi:MAG: enoyl-CoA hydratase/isomerase family protein [Burkholderiales bacterium]|nr:enoyl-CoA hydratase/isomerase family protein [Burkholderiales bacterium]